MATKTKKPRIRREQIELHGHEVSYRIAGEGPVILLIHGIAGRSEQWLDAMSVLADSHTVIAPDLLGHGRSAKPRGDYSLGAYAAGLRDLLVALDCSKATVAGHSLGGGIALQFTYQFPERSARLVLVSSGGLGREVHPLLRAATLPGSELVLPLISNDTVRGAGTAVSQLVGRLGFRAGPDIAEFARGYGSLSDGDARQAFLHTLRAVIDHGGQRVNASDRLYLAEDMPTLIVWGRRDPIIPVQHAGVAHRGMPGSRLEVFDDAGHFPQLDEPLRFARTLADFIESTEPADVDADSMRKRLV
ncbi:MAG TPA: alpha/beta fold hydrolase [Candidatus Limnocylindria bacterium]|nr:alpha/beta fold hydrolase [Candidatus Limnocylindria bacterium]